MKAAKITGWMGDTFKSVYNLLLAKESEYVVLAIATMAYMRVGNNSERSPRPFCQLHQAA